MLKNYTAPFSAHGKEIAVVSTIIHNPSDAIAIASMWIENKNIILDIPLNSKESLFLDTKIFLSGDDFLAFDGCDFTISVSEDDVV